METEIGQELRDVHEPEVKHAETEEKFEIHCVMQSLVQKMARIQNAPSEEHCGGRDVEHMVIEQYEAAELNFTP
jgi:hypothetical protein